jgi:type VI protein secretion system component Hcp
MATSPNAGIFPLYMKFPDAKGSVTHKEFDGWIALSDVNFGIKKPVSSQHAADVGFEAGTPMFSEVSVTKNYDRATEEMMRRALLHGKQGMAHEVQIVISGAARPDKPVRKYVRYVLQDVVVTSFSLEIGDSAPVEKIELVFRSMYVEIAPSDSSNRRLAGTKRIYDISLATLFESDY